mgnify:CR=1 FL=1
MSVKMRNWNAVDAHFRNSAGPMKDKRSPRGGSENRSRDYIDDFVLETQEENSVIVDKSDVVSEYSQRFF